MLLLESAEIRTNRADGPKHKDLTLLLGSVGFISKKMFLFITVLNNLPKSHHVNREPKGAEGPALWCTAGQLKVLTPF